MNIVVKSALASVALAFAYACATPIEIGDDVQVVNPNLFGDAGPLGGAAGAAGQSGAPPGGTGVGVGGTGSGSGGASGGLSGMPVGVSGGGGLPVAGAGGSGAGGTAGGSGGAAGAGAGAGGAAGTAGAGTAGNGGTGSGAVFDVSSCDFENTAGCEALECEVACPQNSGAYCPTNCAALIDCVSEQVADPEASCVTAADPLCGTRNGGQTSACTTLVESSGGLNATGTNQPSFVARQLVECICSLPRP